MQTDKKSHPQSTAKPGWKEQESSLSGSEESFLTLATFHFTLIHFTPVRDTDNY